MQLHPHLTAILAAEHVNDMRRQGARSRRARAARRARRGALAPQAPVTGARPLRYGYQDVAVTPCLVHTK
jgi:hypothetical protein